jgi:hypothetical protein
VFLVSVAGASSRAGKTALAVTLLAAARGRRAAVKFTTTEDVFRTCPRGTSCVVCDIDVPFRLIDDPAVLDEPGTDTARLQASGAAVVWAIARRAWVQQAWSAVRERLAGFDVAVVEGSTIVETAVPDLVTFVAHPFLAPARWKPTSPALLRSAHAVVVNRPAAEARPPAPAVLSALRAARGADDLLVADVTGPLGAWAPALLDRLSH